MKLFLLVCVALLAVPALCVRRKQEYWVKGKFMCGDQPVRGIKVRLEDYDFGPSIDDHLDVGETDNDGFIELRGNVKELGNIDPVIKAWHRCENGINPCPQRWRRELPKKFINHKKQAYNFGEVQLMIKGESVEHDCTPP